MLRQGEKLEMSITFKRFSNQPSLPHMLPLPYMRLSTTEEHTLRGRGYYVIAGSERNLGLIPLDHCTSRRGSAVSRENNRHQRSTWLFACVGCVYLHVDRVIAVCTTILNIVKGGHIFVPRSRRPHATSVLSLS